MAVLRSSDAIAVFESGRNVRAALAEREHLIGPYRERYDRLHDDPRVAQLQLVKAAEELVRVAYKADHIYEERVAEGLVDYQRRRVGSDGSRF